MKRLLASAAVAMAWASPAIAAVTLITNGGGQLTGATGVIVYGVSYDVAFIDGHCSDVFDGCDSSSDFDLKPGRCFRGRLCAGPSSVLEHPGGPVRHRSVAGIRLWRFIDGIVRGTDPL